MKAQPLIVGIDDSDGAGRALDWAVQDAAVRHAELLVVGAYEMPALSEEEAVATDYEQFLRWRTQQTVDAAVKRAKEALAEDHVTGEVCAGRAAEVLVARGETADRIVVGSRRLHGVQSFVLGSVGMEVAAAAPCPVLVVRDGSTVAEGPVQAVAGIAPTAESQDVLRFAFDHASRHDLRLHVVMCTYPDPLTTPHSGWAQVLEREAAPYLAEAVAGWQERYPEVQVTTEVVAAHVTPELVAQSAGQSLLVVGKHRHRPIVNALLGSASQGVLHHATCPVAVVPVQH